MKRGDLLKLSGKQDAIFVAAIQVAEMVPTEKGMRKVVWDELPRGFGKMMSESQVQPVLLLWALPEDNLTGKARLCLKVTACRTTFCEHLCLTTPPVLAPALQPGDALKKESLVNMNSKTPTSLVHETWKAQGAEIVNKFYAGAMFVGHDGLPIVNLKWLESLPRDRDYSKRSSARSSNQAENSEAGREYIPLSEVKPEEIEDPEEEVVEALDSLSNEAETKRWSQHMTWCNKQVKKESKSFQEIIDLVSSAHHACTVVSL